MAYDATTLPDVSGLTVGIIGGTGDQGRGLAYRFARAGQTVLIGSRTAERATQAAAEIAALPYVPEGAVVSGGDNEDVARRSDVVIVAVPWDGHAATVAALAGPLAGKIVVDCVNPLGFDKQGPYALTVAEGSAVQQAAALLPESRVCAAFNHVSAPLLADPEIDRIDLDVLICTEDRDLVGVVGALAARIPGMRGIYAGRLRNAHQIEAFTANLIAINKRYKAHAGIRVTDL
ncbi:NADPH-dependent F420 reductase [Micromonospora aurantiaca]|uniref:NADPH-dependent F420 reductase n=1 Tax=Micromonospora aurantiaca (nom. illeg.) TaxID=47850 RepID=UPI000827CAE6|nr:NADPH-dependent F420 reductase [Micromonospora aurantiaca]MBC9001095.1 NADPH-dependent F420 reductase [Micromonospora aurantiaca]RNH98366.1 NADPH-dependent F420 reductase [Micromonospora aurantiaca]SCL42529.1 reduced coenzyme F420:NADP oxidoreductase [Micromonospora aurantiaca]